MAVNPDAAQELDVSFRPAPAGSCFTDEQLAQLAQMLVVKLPEGGDSEGQACTSKDANNIASVDADGCILVPASKIYREEQTWDASAPTENLEFTEFAGLGFDALVCGLAIHIYLSSTETGTAVVASPTGVAHIRPSYEIIERSAGKIEIAIKNATQDVRVEIELTQVPLPVPTT